MAALLHSLISVLHEPPPHPLLQEQTPSTGLQVSVLASTQLHDRVQLSPHDPWGQAVIKKCMTIDSGVFK